MGNDYVEMNYGVLKERKIMINYGDYDKLNHGVPKARCSAHDIFLST